MGSHQAMETVEEALESLLHVKANQKKYIWEIVESFRAKLKASGNGPTSRFLNTLSSHTQNSVRLNIMLDYFEWIPLNAEIGNKYKKDKHISYVFRNMGNIAYGKKCWMDALKAYNLALLFAAPGEAELGLAYANRSATLQYLGLIEEALEDIDLALANNYPDEPKLRDKLDQRKTRFQELIRERSRDPTFENLLETEISDRNTFYKDLFSLKAPNSSAPALEDSVDIRWNSERGRHVVANKNIPMGTTILVEKPFIAVLERALNWDTEHCHHCFKRNIRCIPCPSCVFTLFCDETCRAEALKEYHQYECPCLPELHCVLKEETGKSNFHLAFKLICMLGPSKLDEMFTERKNRNLYSELDMHVLQSSHNGNGTKQEDTDEDDTDTEGLIPGSDPETGLYTSFSYRALYNLLTTTIPKDCYFLYLLSLTLSRALHSNTDFCESIQTHDGGADKYEFQNFIAELVVHHFETFQRNVFGLNKITHMDGVTLRTYMESQRKGGGGGGENQEYGFERFAFGAYATASLLNHSCDQNVMRFTGKRFGRLALIALKSLKKGEELLISYGVFCGSLDDKSTQARQALLNETYNFSCECIACTYDWPTYSDLLNKKPSFSCPRCSAKFPHESKMSMEYLQCVLLPGEDFKCRRCSHQYSKESVETEYERNSGTFGMCLDLYSSSSNPSLKAISYLKSALQYYENNLVPPSHQSLDGSHLYRDLINLLIFFSESNE